MNNFLSSKLSREVKVIDDPKVVAEKSRDFSHTSPFLLEKMKKHKADVVVLPQSEEDVEGGGVGIGGAHTPCPKSRRQKQRRWSHTIEGRNNS
ncbi:hypothetical protein [Sulfuracidifex metallicus]|uniref:hypothetical protein n=1 Tax=Sulfuracidifex metallicus TaxID=47303 RepID=UPI00138DE1C7|nr:hypothetical protein [Sulfuracidifex metallicus]